MIPPDHVISHSPIANTSLSANQDVIFLVSSGQTSSIIYVEQYRWRSYFTVKQELEEQGIDVVIHQRYTFNSTYINRIFLQNKPKGTPLYEGDTIELHVGIPVDETIIENDLKNIEILRVYNLDVPIQLDQESDPFLTEEQQENKTRLVSLYIVDAKGKRKILEEKLLQGTSIDLPYKSIGSGQIEIYLEHSFFTRTSF